MTSGAQCAMAIFTSSQRASTPVPLSAFWTCPHSLRMKGSVFAPHLSRELGLENNVVPALLSGFCNLNGLTVTNGKPHESTVGVVSWATRLINLSFN